MNWVPQYGEAPRCPVPGLIGDIVNDFSAGGIDSNLALGEALGFMSLLTQALADVRSSEGTTETIGANILVAAPSAAGKTVAFKQLLAPVLECLEHHVTDGGSPESARVLIEDATRQAMLEQLQESQNCWWGTDEAGQMVDFFRRGAPLLAKLLDATPLHRARVASGHVVVKNYRMSALLLLQPPVFHEIWQVTKGNAVGAFNRFLFFRGAPIRIFNGDRALELSANTRKNYHSRAYRLMAQSLASAKAGAPRRPALNLTAQARRHLSAIRHEGCQAGGGHASSPRLDEYRARHSQRTMRLAASYHTFEFGLEGEIGLSTVEMTERIARPSQDTLASLCHVPSTLTPTEIDAKTVAWALREIVTRTGVTRFRMGDLRRSAPNIGLTKARLEKAVAALGGAWAVQVFPEGRHDVLQVMPAIWSVHAHAPGSSTLPFLRWQV